MEKMKAKRDAPVQEFKPIEKPLDQMSLQE
jgi:hypothetical protein